jgi:UDP-glucuronate 4-epimerase
MKERVIVTGGAGFIGSHLIDDLLVSGLYEVTCIDNFDGFYDRALKESNIAVHHANPNFCFIETDIVNFQFLNEKLIGNYDTIIHLAAKAGVRPSLEDPIGYQIVNIVGLQTMLEISKIKNVKQFVFASSSSVYGINQSFPWKETITDLIPISPYAASKISGEWLGKCHSSLFETNFIGLRFFTVFGPRQRPDLAINKFVTAIKNQTPIKMYGDGSTSRDYTFVKDTVAGIRAAMEYKSSKFEIFNLGNSYPVKLIELIESIEDVLGKKAIIDRLPEQIGDVPHTLADISKAKLLLNYSPKTSLTEGLNQFIKWKKSLE